MRALFVSGPGVGHSFPLVPLAWALRAAGHDVRMVMAGPALAVSDAGLPAVDAAPGAGLAAFLGPGPEAPREMMARTTTIRDLSEAVPIIGRFSDVVADAVVAQAEAFRPDIVVHSQADGAGLLAAAKLGVPLVDHGLGVIRGGDIHAALHRHLAGVFARHGAPARPPRGATVDVAPPSLAPTEPGAWPMRYVPYNGGAVLPGWLSEPPSRPRIAVTLGTAVPWVEGLAPARRILDLAASVDAELVLALGEVDTSGLGDLPGNARAVGWVPLNELLRSCAALVHHGGEGTTMTALATGTPQLAVPDGAGRHVPAAAVERRGAGLARAPEELDAAALTRLLADESLAAAAREVRDEIAARPAPAEVVARLVELVEG